ncbi:MAG: glycerol kinase GlpK [Bacteroidales bacterium]|nr:glycerol kinase GlpK [Bacteroidales bacterium]
MILAIDQSTSGTKLMLFNEQLEMVKRINKAHRQYYPQPGWVEHDAEEIYDNVVSGIKELLNDSPEVIDQLRRDSHSLSLAITNQRETVVVWDKNTARPIAHAVVWQCLRGAECCNALKAAGHGPMVQEKSGLIIDPYFSASGAKWLLDNIEGARAAAERGDLLMGTMESWLIWRLTGGRQHVTDVTNASRTLLMNIHSLQWDEELMRLFTIPATMLPRILPCDSIFGETDIEGLLPCPIEIAGVLGDSHGALAGQMCFEAGLGKATYGTGSSVMVNIGEGYSSAPDGLVTSVAFAAAGKCFYAFEGNIHCTGATLKWLQEQMQLIESPADVEPAALSVTDNGGVYMVPAFAGLGAPWWNAEARAAIVGMSLATSRAHILRAALESIGYQVNDLIQAMMQTAGIALKEIRVDGGPTRNATLMQFQADLLGVPVNCSDVEEASAMGAVVMNVLGRGVYASLEDIARQRRSRWTKTPQADPALMQKYVEGWHKAVKRVL